MSTPYQSGDAVDGDRGRYHLGWFEDLSELADAVVGHRYYPGVRVNRGEGKGADGNVCSGEGVEERRLAPHWAVPRSPPKDSIRVSQCVPAGVRRIRSTRACNPPCPGPGTSQSAASRTSGAAVSTATLVPAAANSGRSLGASPTATTSWGSTPRCSAPPTAGPAPLHPPGGDLAEADQGAGHLRLVSDQSFELSQSRRKTPRVLGDRRSWYCRAGHAAPGWGRGRLRPRPERCRCRSGRRC